MVILTVIPHLLFGVACISEAGGGAIFADQTNLIFREVKFMSNTANAEGGGAVLGQTGPYQNTSASFCNCTFEGNKAPTFEGKPPTDNLFFRTYTFPTAINRVDVHFCDTPVPEGSSFTQVPNGGYTEGTGE